MKKLCNFQSRKITWTFKKAIKIKIGSKIKKLIKIKEK